MIAPLCSPDEVSLVHGRLGERPPHGGSTAYGVRRARIVHAPGGRHVKAWVRPGLRGRGQAGRAASYWRAIATRSRSSGEMKWSLSSGPVQLHPVDPAAEPAAMGGVLG